MEFVNNYHVLSRFKVRVCLLYLFVLSYLAFRDKYKPEATQVNSPALHCIPLYFTSAVAQQAMQALVQPEHLCPSVRFSHSGIVSKRTKRHDFFTDRAPEDTSFCKYPDHPEIRKGSPERGKAIYETGVGTNWRFSTFKPSYLGNGARLLLTANRKSHARFQLAINLLRSSITMTFIVVVGRFLRDTHLLLVGLRKNCSDALDAINTINSCGLGLYSASLNPWLDERGWTKPGRVN